MVTLTKKIRKKGAEFSYIVGMIVIIAVGLIILSAFFGGPKAMLQKAAKSFGDWTDQYFYALKQDKEVQEDSAFPNNLEQELDAWLTTLNPVNSAKGQEPCLLTTTPLPTYPKEYRIIVTDQGKTITYQDHEGQYSHQKSLEFTLCYIKKAAYQQGNPPSSLTLIPEDPLPETWNIQGKSKHQLHITEQQVYDIIKQPLYYVANGNVCVIPQYGDAWWSCATTPENKIGIDSDCLKNLEKNIKPCQSS